MRRRGSRSSPTDGPRRPALRWIGALAGLALLVLLFWRLGPGRIWALFQSIGPNLLLVVVIYGCHEATRVMALSRCLVPGERVSFVRLFRIRLVGEAVRTLTQTGPFMSEPARAWMLARQGLGGPRAYGAAISEIVANTFTSSLVTLGVVIFALGTDLAPQVVALCLTLAVVSLVHLTLVVIALMRRAYVISAILRVVRALPLIGRRVRADSTRVRETEDAILTVLRDRPDRSMQVLLLELVAQAILVFELYWTLRSMGSEISLGSALLVEALTKIVNGVHLLGATEGSFALIFEWLGMTAAAGFTLSLVKRVRSLALAALGLALMPRMPNAPSEAEPTALRPSS